MLELSKLLECLLVDGGFAHGEENAFGLLCAVTSQLRTGAGKENPIVKLRQSTAMLSQGVDAM